MQDHPNGSQPQQPHPEATYGGGAGHEYSNKRSKYVSPEPGEIADDSDRSNDSRGDALGRSQNIPLGKERRSPRAGGGDHHTRYTPKVPYETKQAAERELPPANSLDGYLSAPEPGEVVDSDSYSPRRDDSMSPRRVGDPLPSRDAQYHPQTEKPSDRQRPETPTFQKADRLSANKYTPNWDGYERPRSHSRRSSKPSSRSNSVGSRPNDTLDSRRSSSGDVDPPDSPLTPTELALLGMDNDSTDESDSGRVSPKRRAEAMPPVKKKRRAKVHEAYR